MALPFQNIHESDHEVAVECGVQGSEHPSNTDAVTRFVQLTCNV